jgi:hypothetical protein
MAWKRPFLTGREWVGILVGHNEGYPVCAVTKRLVGEITVRQRVNSEHKGQETDKHPSLICTIECTATLGEVCTQTVEGHHKPRDVEGIADEYTLTVEGDNSGASTQN